ncbi:MAG: bifunctional DNA-formamidopyrimidine glycosylase/DNA-(apurinic or apyrimidinic site) lyase [Gemmatimonadaceae bacterium]|nr:bifunctional DNA-formamidopyrimidine glycosylase/DNA-(apurinic or apyrimidinic site) lyase [Gemmatimonadaceae bacterium]
MPELPEVDAAARYLDAHVAGRTLRDVTLLHPAIQRVDQARLSSLVGRRVQRAERVAKWQELLFEGGARLVVHFRMTGDWVVTRTGTAPRHARAHFAFSGRQHLWLVDPRALARLEVRLAGEPASSRVGPDALDPSLDAAALRARFASRRTPVKQVLLDQGVLAGVGNIYAAEALWHARVHPGTPANRLSLVRVERVLAGIRWTMGLAFEQQGRHQYGEATDRFAVYDRAAEPCLRCGTPIARMVQGQRSTYWCRRCQR